MRKKINEYQVLFILEAAAVTGILSMKKRQDMLITTVDEKKQDMFNKAKMEVIERFKKLQVSHIH